jgi:hypothetical protein
MTWRATSVRHYPAELQSALDAAETRIQEAQSGGGGGGSPSGGGTGIISSEAADADNPEVLAAQLAARAHEVGTDAQCSTRHGMSFNVRHEVSKCV